VSSLHADAYNWTGWNALIAGQKLWRFYPPQSNARYLYTKIGAKLGGLIGSWTSEVNTYHSEKAMLDDGEGPDYKAFPLFKNAPEPMEVIQEPGEVIVIPSGWFHQVYHLTESVALASQCASKGSFMTIIETIMDYNEVSWTDCESFGEMPKPNSEMEDAEYKNKAKILIDTVLACAKHAYDTNPNHKTTKNPPPKKTGKKKLIPGSTVHTDNDAGDEL